MIKSMTAYARAQNSNEQGDISIEIRSVNHRYLETSLRLPEDFKNQESDYKKIIAAKVKRGKVDVALRYNLHTQQLGMQTVVNTQAVENLLQAEQQVLALTQGSRGLSVTDILNWPGVLEETAKDTSGLLDLAKQTLENALQDFIAGREKEGGAIAEMLSTRCDAMSQIIQQIEQHRPQVLKHIEDKWRNTLQEKITTWAEGIEQGRLEQEMVIIAQKLDIDEEIDRLNTHLKEVKDVLKRKEAVGRRLDFLMQELNREANTLSSKSQDSKTTQLAVDLKVLIEQMREQVQNIE